jgi:transposase-like protein
LTIEKVPTSATFCYHGECKSKPLVIAEEEMSKVERYEEIRRAYFVQDKTIRQIAREFKCSRPTVRKAIVSAQPRPYTLKAGRAAPVLGSYKARIDELLAENERLPRKQRRTGHKIYAAIKAEGYAGSESSVRVYIAQQPCTCPVQDRCGERRNGPRCTSPSSSTQAPMGRWIGEKA